MSNENQYGPMGCGAMAEVPFPGPATADVPGTTKSDSVYAVDGDVVALADMARMFVRTNQYAESLRSEGEQLRVVVRSQEFQMNILQSRNANSQRQLQAMRMAGQALQEEANGIIGQLKQELTTTAAAAVASSAMADEAKAQIAERDSTIAQLQKELRRQRRLRYAK